MIIFTGDLPNSSAIPIKGIGTTGLESTQGGAFEPPLRGLSTNHIQNNIAATMERARGSEASESIVINCSRGEQEYRQQTKRMRVMRRKSAFSDGQAGQKPNYHFCRSDFFRMDHVTLNSRIYKEYQRAF